MKNKIKSKSSKDRTTGLLSLIFPGSVLFKTISKLMPDSFNYPVKKFLKKNYFPKIIKKAPIYQKYNYYNSRNNGRGLIDFQLGVFYNRIPKAGNSTVVGNLYMLKNNKEITPTIENIRYAKKSFLIPSQLKYNEVSCFSDLFKFTFVRNPYSRVLSAYLDKVHNKNKKKFNSVTFLDFLLYLEQEGLYSNQHWVPQKSLLLIPMKEFDLIGKIENFNNDFELIINEIYRKNPSYCLYNDNNMNKIKFAPHSTNACEKLKQYYDEKTFDVVSRLYKDDFEAFGYDDALFNLSHK